MAMMPIEALRSLINDMDTSSPEELVSYLLMGARFSALPGGDASFLTNWERRIHDCGGFWRALVERINSGLDDLDAFPGRDSGAAVVGAQDMTLLMACFEESEEPEVVVPYCLDVNELAKFWIHEAEYAALEQKDVTFIEEWLETYPIDPEKRLGVVEAPFSVFETAIFAAPELTQAMPVQYIDLGAAAKAAEAEKSLMAATDKPSRKLRDLMRLERVPINVETFGTVYIDRELGNNYRLVLMVTLPDGSPCPLHSVRFGFWPARRGKKGGRWYLDLAPFPPPARWSALRGRIWLITENGGRVCLT